MNLTNGLKAATNAVYNISKTIISIPILLYTLIMGVIFFIPIVFLLLYIGDIYYYRNHELAEDLWYVFDVIAGIIFGPIIWFDTFFKID